jgi:protein O-GlcNAc transferase
MLQRLLSHIASRLQRSDGRYLTLVPSLVRDGRHAEAERILTRRLRRFPADAEALHYLGLVCFASARYDQAVGHLREAVALAPDALFHSNLSEAYRLAGDLERAEQHARQAVELAPDNVDFALRLSVTLARRFRPLEALVHARRAHDCSPRAIEPILLVAGYQAELGSPEALEWYDKALAVEPQHAAALIGRYRARRWLCDWRDGDAAMLKLLERWAANPRDAAFEGSNPFVAYELDAPQEIRDAITQGHADTMLRRAAAYAAPQRSAARSTRIRVGYLSADYHNHPTMHLMRGLFACHDRSRFDIRAYSLGPDDGSAFRRDLIGQVDAFRDLVDAGVPAVADAIARDGIDILVDLKGFTHGARPEVLALRPAPLRVAWLGYPASTGSGLNDYLIADPVVAPESSARHFGEKLVWLPHSYQVTDAQPIDAAPDRRQLGLPDDAFVFACFNHVYKIDAVIFARWMRILERVPGSVLWLYSDHAQARVNLRAEAQKRNVDPSRVLFAGTLPKPQHLARLARADLFLDTLQVNAHTGASDALWAGLPVLTCPQTGFPSRVAASVLTAAGLAQLVCDGLDDYEEKAVALASRPGELSATREQLRAREGLPLFDTRRFARNLERAYEMMWERHRRGLPADAFHVPPC